MARRARGRRSADDSASGPSASPYVQRGLPFFDVIDESTIEKLESQVDWLLQEVGIEFRDDPEAHRIWKEAGANVDGTRVRADAAWIRELCGKAPREFQQVARNPARNVTIGGTNQVFAPIYGAPFVRDLKGGRRYGDMLSFEKLVKLAYMHPNLHHTGLVICEPCDVPVSHRHLDMVYTHMRLSDKPHLGAITEMSRAQDSVDMAEILHGRDVMESNCVIMGNVNTNSPLLVDKVVSEAIRVYCGRGQGIIVVPFILSGAMGPVSTAASVTQAMAEAMARDAYGEVEPAGHFLGCSHTMRNYQTAFYEPALSDSENVESWEDAGEKDMRQRAYEKWTAMLEAYEAPTLDASKDEALQEYIARRKNEIPEAWY